MTRFRMHKLWSDIKYWLVILIFMAILFEIVASMILFRKYTYGKLAILHFTEKFSGKGPGSNKYLLHQNARPDSARGISNRIADETFGAGNFTYEPWLMFRVADYHSKYVNIKGFERRSDPGLYIAPSSSDTLDIYFFGGSEMFGTHLSDAETIPSQFLSQLIRTNPAKTIRARNFAVPFYYSRQQLMLLSILLFQGHRPDIIIFLNGVTDFYPSRILFYDKPFYSYVLQQAFEGKMFKKGNHSFTDTTKQLYDDVPGMPAGSYYDSLISKYEQNIQQISAFCKKAGIKSYFFCQPVPFYHYTSKDAAAFMGNYRRFEYIYPKLQENKSAIENFFFLGDMQQSEKRNMYIDGLDYSPSFCGKVAERMLSIVKRDLP